MAGGDIARGLPGTPCLGHGANYRALFISRGGEGVLGRDRVQYGHYRAGGFGQRISGFATAYPESGDVRFALPGARVRHIRRLASAAGHPQR
ncbi:hypothetical protein D3C72_1653130 [compost metagenome]